MGKVRVFPSTQEQVAAVDAKLDEINVKITPQFTLSQVTPYVLDFVNDPIMIISGGLDTYRRTISN